MDVWLDGCMDIYTIIDKVSGVKLVDVFSNRICQLEVEWGRSTGVRTCRDTGSHH